MLSSSCSASIELIEPREYYTNGDIVRGRVIVENSRPVDIKSIEVKLRCEEEAVVWISNAQGGYSQSERLKLLAMDQRLFPPAPPPGINGEPQSDETSPSLTYRYNTGSRDFEFAFMIPPLGWYPGTLQLRNSNSRISWYVKVLVRRSELMSSNPKATAPFTMIPAGPPPDLYDLATHIEATRLKTHLPGRATGIRGLFPDSDHRKLTEVRLAMVLPASGIPQSPLPLSVLVNIESDDGDLLILRKFELFLKQKTTVFVDRGWHRDYVRDRYDLVTIGGDVGLKEGADVIKEAVQSARISDVISESFDSPHFAHEYKIVAEAIVASRHKPSNKLKLRVSVPVHVFGKDVGGTSACMPDDPLPLYAAEPRHDEELLSPPGILIPIEAVPSAS